MPHIITKEWRGYQMTVQLADRRVYDKLWQAEEELEELYREFPGRVFRIREATDKLLPPDPDFPKPGIPLPNTTVIVREQAKRGEEHWEVFTGE